MPTHAEFMTILRSVPPAFWDASARALVAAGAKATKATAGFPPLVKRDVFSHIQRAYFETLWQEVAERFDGVACELVENDAGTSSFLKVRIGEKLVLTQSAVTSRVALPRPADFRSNLSSQIHMFDRNDEPDTVYAILLHAHDKNFETGYLAVVVPNRKCTSVLAKLALDDALAAARPDALDAESTADAEQIAEPMPGQLREAAKKVDEQSGT